MVNWLAGKVGLDVNNYWARVINHDFSTPWLQFFDSLLQSSEFEIADKPCFEIYLNDGNQDGHWDIEMYVAVNRIGS